MQPSPSEAVSQAEQAKAEYESAMSSFSKNPAAAVGMSDEEFKRRREAAAAPRQVTLNDKTFKVQSTARAQQIMQQGTTKMAHNKRMEELQEKMAMLKNLRWIVIGTGVAAMSMLAYYMILPRYVVHAERSRRNQMRFEQMQQQRYAQYEQQQQQQQQQQQSEKRRD